MDWSSQTDAHGQAESPVRYVATDVHGQHPESSVQAAFSPVLQGRPKDGKGGYRFDRMSLPAPFDALGFFRGYMSGPIMAESPEERKTRHSHIVELPEKPAPEE